MLEANTTYKVKSLEICKPIRIMGRAGSVIMLYKGGLNINFVDHNTSIHKNARLEKEI
jgi:hypothetical protein